jgi:hypothetical protein
VRKNLTWRFSYAQKFDMMIREINKGLLLMGLALLPVSVMYMLYNCVDMAIYVVLLSIALFMIVKGRV